jgi:hypothetical protein
MRPRRRYLAGAFFAGVALGTLLASSRFSPPASAPDRRSAAEAARTHAAKASAAVTAPTPVAVFAPAAARAVVANEDFRRIVGRASQRHAYSDLPADVAALLDDDEPMRVARTAAAMTGVWPLSFALPTVKWRAVPTLESNASTWLPRPPCRSDTECLAVSAGPPTFYKTKDWATIVPGNISTYVFRDEGTYMDDYAASWYAHTFRKSGYDCMRHLEIIGAGALPVFRDAARIPPYIMTHYPKRLLVHIEAHHAAADEATRAAWREALLRWGVSHLTTTARVRYMAAAAGLGELPAGTRVAFIDASLLLKADYSSVMCLIGLLETLGHGVDVLYEPAYLFSGGPRRYDSRAHWKPLYGGGFNYVQALPALLRTPRQPRAAILANLAAGAYDVVVYGSWTRSKAHAKLVLGRYPRQRVWLVDSGDTPMGWHRDAQLRAAATIFVRELTG